MKKNYIPVSKPNLTNDDFLEIKKAFDASWISSKSPWVDKFEKEYAKRVSGTKYAVAVNSGTSAIFLALKALGIGPRDEVIIPTLTMIATVNAVSWVGAKTILVDSRSENDWNMNPDQIEKKITSRTKAIMPVHLYGYPCDMSEIIRIAKKHNLFIIEDAAEAMGALYRGKKIGSLSTVSCFSLYANKIITTGNGGMVCTDSKKIYELVKKLEFFDFNEKIHFKHNIIGYNLVLSGLQAALGYSQVKRFESLVKKRRLVYTWYKYNLKSTRVRFVDADINNNPNYWFPVVILKNRRERDRIKNLLFKSNIETRDFFLPVHMQPIYKTEYKAYNYPLSEYFFERGLLLPNYYDLNIDQVKVICNFIKKSTE